MHSQGSNLSKETVDLIKAIGDSRSKQEEDKIIIKECETLKKKIRESGISPKKMKEYLLRAIYVEMLGHEAPFTHLAAVNLTQDKNLLNKRVGYLACSLLLSDQSELLIMLIASLQKDIQSNQWIEVCMALISVVKFANMTIIQALTEPVMSLLKHKNEQIKKKAVICLFKFYQVCPASVPDCDSIMRNMLCDNDPSVMGATLCYFKEMVLKTPEKYKDLVSPLIVILKQIIEHKLPREFDYHRFPAPWIQVTLLEILSILGKDDQSASEYMYEIIAMGLRRADDTGINIGHAIVYQCLKTICTIYPNPHLIELASSTISRFLSSESPNLRCTGINGLTLIIKINPTCVANHQRIIVDCLDANDETLKKNTFELLYQMTTSKNVETIVDQMINYLKRTTLESVSKRDILTKITELTERFAPSKTWFIRVMNQLFVNFGDMITDDILSKLIKIINEWEKETEDLEEFKSFTIENYAIIVENYAVLPDSFVKLMAWIIGEYANKLYANDNTKIEQILQMVIHLLNKSYHDDMTKCLLISAIAKVHSNMNFIEIDFVTDVFEKYSRDKNPEVQQRCLEYKRMKLQCIPIEKNQFSNIGDEIVIDSSLSFLNSYVKSNCNDKIYDEDFADNFCNKFITNDFTLNVGPYDTPANILSMPTNNNDMNRLYEAKDNNRKDILKSELNVNVAQKWGDEGYTDKKISNPSQRRGNAPDFTQSMTAVSSTSYSPSGAVMSAIGRGTGNVSGYPQNSPYISVGGGKPGESGSSYVSNVVSGPTINDRKKTEKKVEDHYSIEKKQLMNDLFGGLGVKNDTTTSTSTTTSSIKHNSNSYGKPAPREVFNQPKQQHQHHQVPIQKAPINLLDINELTSSNPNPNPISTVTQPIQQSNPFDILSDIFGAPQATQSQSQPIKQSEPKQQGSLFDNLGDHPSNNITKQQNPKINFSFFQITTDDFEEIWGKLPDEKQYDMKANVASPQLFHQIISSKGNFSPVAIDANEAISSAKYKNQTVLVHATITPGNVPLQIKCQNASLNDEIANYIMNIFQ